MQSDDTGVELTGCVLCGGQSRRLGTDKALLDVGGRPLVRVVADRLRTVADPVFLATGTAGRRGDLGYPEVSDETPGQGPLGGIAAALAASPHRLVAVVAVDMPDASADVLADLAAAWRAGDDVVAPHADGRIQPLHAVWAVDALAAVRRALVAGRLAVHDVLGDLSLKVVGEETWHAVDPAGRFARNINRPEDVGFA
jgi:molybdenum cofactor guanylyltransferase